MNAEYIPKLIEPGTKYFLKETLSRCNIDKSIYFNSLFNIGLFFIFILILGMILIYKNNTKLTVQDKIKKKELFKKYLLEKIRKIKTQKYKDESITKLPNFESTFVNLHKNYYNI